MKTKIRIGLLILSLIVFTGCTRSRVNPEYNEYGIKRYIVDKFDMKYWERGVYDINRNNKVDVGIDYFFFAKNPDENGSHVWYLHEITMWEDDEEGEVTFMIGQYPVKIEVDESGEGTPDIRYYAKPGIEHDGYVKFYYDIEAYNLENK